MDWIHCNMCFLQPGDIKDKRYFLTSCGHIYCDSCIKPDSAEKCKVCESKYTTIPLTSQMKPEVQEFFSDIDEMIGKVSRVIQFQVGHRVRLVQHQRAMVLKYKAAKDEIRRYHEIIKALQKKNKELEKEVQSLKRYLQTSPDSRSIQSTQSRTKFVMTPNTQSQSQSVCKSTPPFTKIFPRSSPNISQSTPSLNSWVTASRITLPRHSPASRGSSPNSQSAISPDMNMGHGTYVYDSQMSKGGNSFTGPYRTGNQYSSQPTTPRTPSTPGIFSSPGTPEKPHGPSPGMPTSSNTGRIQYVRSGRSTTSSSPIPMSILSLSSQHTRTHAY